MQQVFARFRLPDDRLVDAVPGDIVGRSWSAAVRLNDPRVSEAHALVSLRGSQLRLLALRGRFAVDGAVTSDVVLTSGLVVQIAPRLELTVVAVTVQTALLALEGPLVPRQILPPVASLSLATGAIVPRYLPNADAVVWTSGRALCVRVPGTPDAHHAPGARFAIAGRGGYHVSLVDLSDAALQRTERDAQLDAQMTLVLRSDTVHIQRGDAVVAIDGQPARLLTELGQMGVPVEWRTLADLLWPGDIEESALRSRFDRTLYRLRKRLDELDLRRDLVRLDGSGLVELMLGPRDRLKDEA
ncbi:MAG: FHA domain-containing protein [Myxococcales bacterium]|nr:FHA domain-containing protein [Myxococcales bacterium]MCB9734913.1 FHA domain-containing protein [Deltaproteobacteria bacterium]